MGLHSPPQSTTTSDPPFAFDSSVADSTLTGALAILRKRRWVLIIVVIAGVFVGLYRAMTLTPRSVIVLTITLIALLGGVILLFLLESLGTGLRSINEIEGLTQLPSLALIPRADSASSKSVAGLSVTQKNTGVLATPRSQFAEAFRSLRTSLSLETTGLPPKFILITSATPSEGKTTVATNLACVLAQPNARVLLIDADLRKPDIHHRFGLTGKIGLSTVLSRSATFQSAVAKISDAPNLDVLASGPVPPFPTEMLNSQAMIDLLAQCAEIYTHIVVDSPPVLSVADSTILAQSMDTVVLVIWHGKVSRKAVRRTRDLLRQSAAPVTGVVLNAVKIDALNKG